MTAPTPGSADEDEVRLAVAALAAVRRLRARVATGDTGPDAEISSLPIGTDVRVDCPTGVRVPFPDCLGCPYLTCISLVPPEVRCWRPAD